MVRKGPGREVVACLGKFRYASWRVAYGVKLRMGRRGKRSMRLKVYRCPFCGGFHIGSR